MSRTRPHLSQALLALLLALALALGTAGCSGSGDSTGAEPEAADSDRDTGGGAAPGGSGGSDKAKGVGRAAVQAEAVIHTGEVVLVDDDLADVRVEIDRLLGRYGGQVADETTDNDSDGGTQRSTLVLRVPGRHFEEVLDGFRDFATVQSTRRKGEDVTTEVIDLDARIRTQEVSLRRLRSFLDRAEDVEAMIRLESEIAEREASLESLRAQAAYLADQVAMATITVRMSTPDAPAPKTDPLEDAGFLTGLRGGWEALKDVLVVGATVAGALLPFAALIGLLGAPVALWLRLRRRHATRAA
jgi:hypothetical protein